MRRPSERVYRAVFAVAFIAGGISVGFGAHAIVTPDPKPVIRTVVLDVPPACQEIGAELQAERAVVEHLAEARENVEHASADLVDVALSADPDAIVEQADLLDEAKRTEQQLRLDLAAAYASTSAVVDDCAPERDQ